MEQETMNSAEAVSSHTQGPWLLLAFTVPTNSATGVRHGWHVNQRGGPGYVTTLHQASHRVAEDEANARLIAAAPELLEALREVRKCGNGGAKLSRRASDMVRAAIAKATGDSQ